MSSATGALLPILTRFGSWLAGLQLRSFVLLAVGVAIVKATFFWRGSFFYLEVASFPAPASHLSSNFVPVAMHGAFQQFGLFLGPLLLLTETLALVGATVAFVILLWPYTRNHVDQRLLILLALTWPGVQTVLPWLGNGTAYLPLFLLLGLLGPKLWIRLVGVVGSSATHPEQSFVAYSLLLILSIVPEFRAFRGRATVGASTAFAVTLTSGIWIQTAELNGRFPSLAENFLLSVRFSSRYSILGTYTWWGLWWLVILLVLVLLGKRSRLLYLFVAVMVPGLFAFITDNYTRVFAGTALAVGIASVWLLITRTNQGTAASVEHHDAGLEKRNLALGLWTTLFLLLPTLSFMMPGEGVPVPGAYWIGLIENYLSART
mgnify:CR=1 FL=1